MWKSRKLTKTSSKVFTTKFTLSHSQHNTCESTLIMTETPQAQSPVQVLADLIDAYASAKASGNDTLVRLAVAPLQEFLNQHEITVRQDQATVSDTPAVDPEVVAD